MNHDARVRWGVTLRHSTDAYAIGAHRTFVWAIDRKGGVAAVRAMFAQEPDLWEGWTFTVADAPLTASI